ncbi:MAG: hypothetical protein ACPGQD_01595 [Planctomycetota bacterium]
MKEESKPNTPESAQETSSEQKETQSLKELLSQMGELPLPLDSDSGGTRPRYGASVLDWLKQVEHLTLEEFELQMQMYDELG